MKTNKRISIRFLSLKTAFCLILTCSILASCNNNDDAVELQKANYAIATVAGTVDSRTLYVQGLEHLNITSLDNNNATEVAEWGQMWADRGNVFVTRWGNPATMFKYTLDEDGKLVAAGQLILEGANTFSTLCFISATEAYATANGGLAKVIKFNPITFEITGEIDLAPILNDAADSHWFLGMIERDGKLFMGVDYHLAWSPMEKAAFVAVLDMATSTVEKLISDERTSFIFLSGGASNGFVKAANGDIYVQGIGHDDHPSGILRIKNGTIEFDPDYFFNLSEVVGNPCYGLYHFNGHTFVNRVEDAEKFWDDIPNYRFYKIDLENISSQGALAGVPVIRGASTSLMRKFDNDEILFSVAADTENAIYSYNMASGTASKKITLDGQCTGLEKL